MRLPPFDSALPGPPFATGGTGDAATSRQARPSVAPSAMAAQTGPAPAQARVFATAARSVTA